jgi:hypothetical protein
MKWVTREKIKVDRVACPWLIRKFVDPEAEFVFLPRQTEWGKIDDGTVFDVPNCELGHHGEDVSFNSILKKYNLTEPALLLLGEIVRAADSHPTNPHPAGEGLRWIAGGFGALGLTDHEILEREFTTRFMRNVNGGSISSSGLDSAFPLVHKRSLGTRKSKRPRVGHSKTIRELRGRVEHAAAFGVRQRSAAWRNCGK